MRRAMNPGPIQFAAALSVEPDAERAVADVCNIVGDRLGGDIDLAVAFYTHHFGPAIDKFPQTINDKLKPRAFVGCTGESIIGGGREVESSPALSLWAAKLPGASVVPMHWEFARTPEGPSVAGWPESLAGDWPSGASLLALGEPFSFPIDWQLERLNDDRPGVPVFGGMASGGHAPGQNRVAVGGESFAAGVAAVLIHGPLAVRTVVSQGCKPIGAPLVVTKSERQLIQEVGGRPTLEVLQSLFAELSPEDRALVNGGLHVGRVINEYQSTFKRGDFLIRNCLGADRGTGAVAVADFVRPGQTIQFHVRDAETADEELRWLLSKLQAEFSPRAALLFTCNGRGSRLFDAPDHDAALVQRYWPGLPTAGFFAQGELGPVGGKNFIHGYTASAAFFGPAEV